MSPVRSLEELATFLHTLQISRIVMREYDSPSDEPTLVRLHLIPYCRNQRDDHVSHLPKYKRINKNNVSLLQNCSICQGDLQKGEYMRTLPTCKHYFHKKCIDKWFKRDHQRMSCPICRKSYLPSNLLSLPEVPMVH